MVGAVGLEPCPQQSSQTLLLITYWIQTGNSCDYRHPHRGIHMTCRYSWSALLCFFCSHSSYYSSFDRYTLAIAIYFLFFIDVPSLTSGFFPSAYNSLQDPVCPLILPHPSAEMPLFFRMAFSGVLDSTLCFSICGMHPMSLYSDFPTRWAAA